MPIIAKEELQKYLDNSPYNFNWFDMNTYYAESLSDADLLGRLSQLNISICGYGLIAELCKRFNNKDD